MTRSGEQKILVFHQQPISDVSQKKLNAFFASGFLKRVSDFFSPEGDGRKIGKNAHDNEAVLISYLPKAQAFDKMLATVAQLREIRSDLKIVTLVNLETKNQLPSAKSLFKLLTGCVDAIAIVEGSHLCDELLEVVRETSTEHVILPPLPSSPGENDAKRALRACRSVVGAEKNANCCLLLPRTGEETCLMNPLMSVAKQQKTKVVAYFKSLHDQGLGLSADLSRAPTSPASRLRLPSKPSAFGDVWVDMFLAFNEQHRSLLVNRGFGEERVAVAGYPILYPAYRQLMIRAAEEEFSSQKPIVVFTRGETPSRPASENIVNNDLLKRLLVEILLGIADHFKDGPIIIKPHPIQDPKVITDIVGTLDNHIQDRVRISDAPPSLICAQARLSISTYSSTIIDALAFDVPSIEYFEENEFFRTKHPAGSPFADFGAIAVRDRNNFLSALEMVRAGNAPKADVASTIDHVTSLRPVLQMLSSS